MSRIRHSGTVGQALLSNERQLVESEHRVCIRRGRLERNLKERGQSHELAASKSENVQNLLHLMAKIRAGRRLGNVHIRERQRYKERKTDMKRVKKKQRQTQTQTDTQRQTDRHTDTQTDTHAQTDRHTDIQTYE